MKKKSRKLLANEDQGVQRQNAKNTLSKELARQRQLDGWNRKKQLDKDAWEANQQRTSLRAKQRRSPLQRNSANYKKLQEILPAFVFQSLDQGDFPAPPFWGSLGVPYVIGPAAFLGGRMLQVDGRKIGDTKGKRRAVRSFLLSKPSRIYRSAAWEFATSLRSPRVPRLDVADCLLACEPRRGQKAGAVEIPVYRASTRSSAAQGRAECFAPDALHLYGSGQGPGVCSFHHILLPATVARAAGWKVNIYVEGESDRFLRTGAFLAETILAAAGIKIDCELADEPYSAKQLEIEERYENLAKRLETCLAAHVHQLHLRDETTELFIPQRLFTLPGLADTCAVGSGYDWITREEAFDLGVDRHHLAHFRNHASWRRTTGNGGYWLLEAGFRRRMQIRTFLRPILPAGFEDEAFEVIRLRFPAAKFLEPIVLNACGMSSQICDANARFLSAIKGEQLVAIDHATLHWGSSLDLDVMMRQNRSGLRTIFCSSYAAPDASLNVLASLDDIFAGARREARLLEGELAA